MGNTTNGVAMQTMTYNGQKVKKWFHNDVLVYRAATPYYVVFTDYPITKTSNDPTYENTSISTSSSGYMLCVTKNPDSNSYGRIFASVALPTQGCDKVRIKYRTAGPYTSAKINNMELAGADSDKYAYLDYTGDSITLSFELYDSTGTEAVLIISEIYFYSE